MNSAFYAHLKVGDCDIAVPVASIVQAVDLPAAGATPLPRRDATTVSALDGVIEFEGTVVPVVALDRWVPLGKAASKHDARIVMLREGESMIAIHVDALLGIKQIPSSAFRIVCHDAAEEELFEAVAPASGERPLLCLLEVGRLMKLAVVWCNAAELPPGAAAVDGASVERSAKTLVRHVLFTIGDHLWALPSSSVARLAKTPLAELRLAGQRVCGIGSWEDRKIPLVDLGFTHDGAGMERPWMAVVAEGGLAIGLVVDSCDQLASLAMEDIFLMPGDELRTGTVTVPGRGSASVLDIARLFTVVTEATISRGRSSEGSKVASASGTTGWSGTDAAVQSESVDTDYLIFDADRHYASPAAGLIGVVPLSDTAIEDLAEGRRATVDWRGETLAVVNLPRLDGGKATFAPRVAVVVQAESDRDRTSAIAVCSLTRWLPARSARRSSMRIHSVGEVNVVTPSGWRRSESLVIVDLAQMAYLLD